MSEFPSQFAQFKELAEKDLVSDEDRVEIIMLCIGNDRDWALKSVEGIFKTNYPFKLTIYENSLNPRNTSKIWNKLIKQSTCGYVCLVDSDAVPQNDFVTPLMDAMKTKENVAVVCPVTGGSGASKVQDIAPSDAPGFSVGEHVSGYCWLFKKDVFDQIGYFDEDFVFYGQDSDWCERVLENGKLSMYVCPRAHVTHGNGSLVSVSATRLENKTEFSRQLDANYSQYLCKMKKEKRLLC